MNKAKDIPEDGGFSYAEQEVLHVEVPPILPLVALLMYGQNEQASGGSFSKP